MKSFLSLLLITGATHLCAQEFIVQPFAVSDTVVDFANYNSSVLLIDGTGLDDSTIVETNDPIPGTRPSHTDNNITGMFRYRSNAANAGVTVSFDLANDTTTFDLSGMLIWNYNEDAFGTPQSDRGFRDVTIEWSNNNGTNWTSLGSFEFAQAPASEPYRGEQINFGSTISGVTDVRFTPTTDWGDGSLIGLSEVRFVAIPEPSTFALVAISMITLIRFRRRMK